jgi:hypothetical protein
MRPLNFILDSDVPARLGLTLNNPSSIKPTLASKKMESRMGKSDSGLVSENQVDELKAHLSQVEPLRDTMLGKGLLHSNDEDQEVTSVPVPVGPQLSWLDQFVLPLLADPRDTVFVKTSIWLFAAVPSAVWLVCVQFNWIHFIFHAIWVGKYATTFVLMLHCVCHRPLYKRQFGLLNMIVPYVLAPFYGHTWNTFYYHHIKHHHIEDNGPNDLSCTLRYQRDSFLHFLHYFFRFLFCTAFELTAYFVKKRWYWASFLLTLGESMSWILYGSMIYLGTLSGNPHAVLAGALVLVIPVLLMRFGMMSGNWAQHAFVDPQRPDCDYVQSLTCIDNHYNKIAFNDGYHTSHHLNPRRHWADHPSNLVNCLEEYAKNGTLVFRGIDFHICWFYLMTKNYAALADAFVHLDKNTPRPPASEIVQMLRRRVARMPDEVIDAYYKAK